MIWRKWFAGCTVVGVVLCGSTAQAVDVRVTIQNLAAADSTAFSPVVIAAHNGSVDVFDNGSAASAGVEDVAELGGVGILPGEITAMQASAVTMPVFATMGGFGPGIFVPGSSGSVVLSLDPVDHRYFSFLSMMVPSNDAFIGNDSPTSIELFNAAGEFVGSDFTLVGSNIWDAGTEVNGLTGALYVVGQDGSASPAEGGVVHPADLDTIFDFYVGQSNPPGTVFNTVPLAGTSVASFSFAVVPEPATWLLVLLGLLPAGGYRSSRRSSRTSKRGSI